LQWLAAVSAASVLPQYARAGGATLVAFNPTTGGFGTDPGLNHPVVPWRRIMEPPELQQTAVLADLILLGSSTAPAPSALGVPDFVDEWISAPYPEQLEDRKIIVEGLRWMDAEAGRRSRSGFLEMDEQSRQKMVADIAQRKVDPTLAVQNKFFQKFRFLVVGAYYTTPEGFKDIGYVGNVPLESYPPMTDQERAIVEKALSALGL
jgi:hypothetical protein